MGIFLVSLLIYGVAVVIYCLVYKCTSWEEYYKKQQESIHFEQHIKEYKNFMNATGKNTLKDIAIEFREDILQVEQNVRRAIRIGLLKGYYLCNQTREILPIKNNNIFSNRKSITIKESIKIKE